jgi:hypothetical protein
MKSTVAYSDLHDLPIPHSLPTPSLTDPEQCWLTSVQYKWPFVFIFHATVLLYLFYVQIDLDILRILRQPQQSIIGPFYGWGIWECTGCHL